MKYKVLRQPNNLLSVVVTNANYRHPFEHHNMTTNEAIQWLAKEEYCGDLRNAVKAFMAAGGVPSDSQVWVNVMANYHTTLLMNGDEIEWNFYHKLERDCKYDVRTGLDHPLDLTLKIPVDTVVIMFQHPLYGNYEWIYCHVFTDFDAVHKYLKDNSIKNEGLEWDVSLPEYFRLKAERNNILRKPIIRYQVHMQREHMQSWYYLCVEVEPE